MNIHFKRPRTLLPAFFLAALLSLSSACAKVSVHTKELPPVLAQDELPRPYDKVATVSVSRERYGDNKDLAPGDYSWAYNALREEAARIGADAVILPEVTIEREIYLFWPTSEMKARGIAIKFH